MQLTRAQQSSLEQEGFVVVRSPLPSADMRGCLAAIASARDPTFDPSPADLNHHRLRPQFPGSVWGTLDHANPFLRVHLHPEVLELAAQITGDADCYYRNGGINELGPERSFRWHRDTEEPYTEFMQYLTSATSRNGCLRVVPGSHRETLKVLASRFPDARLSDTSRQLVTPRGPADARLRGERELTVGPDSLILRSARLLHATTRNSTDEGRVMHHWLFQPSHVANHRFRFDDCLTSALRRSLTPLQRRALWLGRDFELDPVFALDRTEPPVWDLVHEAGV